MLTKSQIDSLPFSECVKCFGRKNNRYSPFVADLF